jgi:hypothetical protein
VLDSPTPFVKALRGFHRHTKDPPAHLAENCPRKTRPFEGSGRGRNLFSFTFNGGQVGRGSCAISGVFNMYPQMLPLYTWKKQFCYLTRKYVRS